MRGPLFEQIGLKIVEIGAGNAHFIEF